MDTRFSDSRMFKVLFWIAYLAVLALIGRDVASSEMMLTIGVVFIIGLFFALLRPDVAIVVAIVSACSLDWLTFVLPFLPGRIVWIQEIMLLALGAATLLKGTRSGFRRTPLNGVVFALLIVGVVSSVMNANSPIVTLLGLRNYFKHLFLFFALINLDFSERYRRKLVFLIMWIAAIQVPLAFMQFFLRSGRSGDVIGGSLGAFASGTLTIFLLMLSGVVIGWYLARPESRLQYALLAAFLLVPAALNETKVLFFAGPLLLVVLTRRGFSIRVGRTLVIVVLSMTMLFGAFQVYESSYGAKAGGMSLLDREYITWYLTTERVEGGAMNRLPAVVFALEEITADPVTTIFGHGPGSASDSTFEFGVGPIYRKYGALAVDSTFAERFILEFGLIGILLFSVLAVLLLHQAAIVYRAISEPFWRGVVIGYEGVVAVMLMLGVYTSTFTIDALSIVFWTLSALVVSSSFTQNDEQLPTGLVAGSFRGTHST